MDKLERLGCLYLTFLNNPAGLSFSRIKEAMPSAYQGDPESARRKFERDKEELKMLGMEVKHFQDGSTLPNGRSARGHIYVPLEEVRKLPELKLSSEELRELAVVIYGAIEENRGKDDEFADRLESVGVKLFYKSPGVVSFESVPMHREFSGFFSSEGFFEKLEIIHEALIKKRAVEIVYPDHHGNREARTVEGRGLVAYRGRWCLIAYCRNAAGIRSFYVDRIREIKILENRFLPEKGFQIRNFSLHPLAIKIHNPRSVRIELDEDRDEVFREFISGLPEKLSQKVRNCGENIVEMESTNVSALFSWMLRHPGAVVKMDPPELRQEFSEYLERMKRLHES